MKYIFFLKKSQVELNLKQDIKKKWVSLFIKNFF